MGFRVLRERRAHRVRRDVAQRHPCNATCVAGNQRRDRVEIVMVGLHRVGRPLTRTTVGKEGANHPGRETSGYSGPSAMAVGLSWITAIIHDLHQEAVSDSRLRLGVFGS